MAKRPEILRERIRERLAATGKSAHAVSVEISANPGYVRDLLDPDKGGTPGAARIAALADALDTTITYLLGDADHEPAPKGDLSIRSPAVNFRHKGAADPIPVVGTAYCDDLAIETDDGELRVERIQLELDHRLRLIARPEALWASRDAYAIDLHGDSMEPALPQGSTRIVDPNRAPRPGDDVIVQLTDRDGSDHITTALVKRFVRQTATHVELTQFNPPQTFRIPRAQVIRLHRIVPYEELVR